VNANRLILIYFFFFFKILTKNAGLRTNIAKMVLIWSGFKEEEMVFLSYLPFLMELLN